MQFFEPLKELIGIHGKRLENRLAGLEDGLERVVREVSSSIASDEYGDISAIAETVAKGEEFVTEIIFESSEGFAWEIRQTAVTMGKEGSCAVYIGGIAPQNLIDMVGPGEMAKSESKYYVPARSRVIFHFYEQPESQNCSAHIQIKRMMVLPETLAVSGRSHEAIDKDAKRPDGAPFRDDLGQALAAATPPITS